MDEHELEREKRMPRIDSPFQSDLLHNVSSTEDSKNNFDDLIEYDLSSWLQSHNVTNCSDLIVSEYHSSSYTHLYKNICFFMGAVKDEEKDSPLVQNAFSFFIHMLAEYAKSGHLNSPYSPPVLGLNSFVDEDRRLCRNQNQCFQVNCAIFSNLNIQKASIDEKEFWIRRFESFIFRTLKDDFTAARVEEFISKYIKNDSFLEAWLQYAIKEEFKNRQSRWMSIFISLDSLRGVFENQVYQVYQRLSPLEKLDFLKKFQPEILKDWGKFQCIVLKKELLLENLLPEWITVAFYYLPYEQFSSDLLKSFALLRKRLKESTEFQTDGVRENTIELLKKLFFILKWSNPQKLFKQYMLLFRATPFPFADETLSVNNKLESTNFYNGYSFLFSKIVYEQYDQYINKDRSTQIETIYLDIMKELVAYCLDRLSLRKGEKFAIENNYYKDEQCTEPSSTWRQGYIKVLLELNLNPDAKAHHLLNFIKKYDPNEEVRALAKRCYSHVRRAPEKCSTQSMQRALIAAEWWLLLVQRKSLGCHIDYSLAQDTRRKALR